jgi:hypothetical protein
MATSQNGWPVYTSGSHPDLVAIPKIIGRVRKGDVATIFTYLVTRFDREVEDVDAGADDWGYAYRAIRGKTSGYSNHASATAIDLNATRHPLGKVGTFSATQRAAIRRILNDLEGVVRWGGDYSGRKDEMHFEINASASAVARVAAKIRGGSLVSNPISGGGSVTVPNVPGAPAPITPEEDMRLTQEDLVAILTAKFKITQAGVEREVSLKDALSAVYFYGDHLSSEVKATPARTWAVEMPHAVTGKDTRAADFLRYIPAEHVATRKVVENVVAAIPGVDPKTVQDAVTQALKGAKITFTVED